MGCWFGERLLVMPSHSLKFLKTPTYCQTLFFETIRPFRANNKFHITCQASPTQHSPIVEKECFTKYDSILYASILYATLLEIDFHNYIPLKNIPLKNQKTTIRTMEDLSMIWVRRETHAHYTSNSVLAYVFSEQKLKNYWFRSNYQSYLP